MPSTRRRSVASRADGASARPTRDRVGTHGSQVHAVIVDELWVLGARAIADLIERREVSAVEVVDTYVRRIEAMNPSINAVVAIAAERARREAEAADARIAHGDRRGPLDGVPFTVKDVVETQGVVTSAGLLERAGTVPAEDAVVVTRLRRAGAILLGK